VAGIPNPGGLPLTIRALWLAGLLLGLLVGLLVWLPLLALLLLALRAFALLLAAIRRGLRLAVVRIVHPGPPWSMSHPARARLQEQRGLRATGCRLEAFCRRGRITMRTLDVEVDMMKQSAFAVLVTCCIALPSAFAHASSDGDCAQQWKSADGNGDGVLEGREADRYLAYYRLHGQAPPEGERISEGDFMRACRDDVFIAKAPETEAPIKGTGGVSQAEAKDRALAAGYSAISSLVKDGDGNWRGSAMKDGKSTKIAVDYKGNVVAVDE
jgi:putative membrane protein